LLSAGQKLRAPAKSTSGAARSQLGHRTRKMAAARKTHGGGRPPKPARCPICARRRGARWGTAKPFLATLSDVTGVSRD